jgi:hypothetical protein
MKFSPLYLLILAILLAACSPLVKAEQPIQSDFIPLQNSETLGQTFTAHYDGLMGIEVYLKGEAGWNSSSVSTGNLILNLRAAPGEATTLGKGVQPLEKVAEAQFYRFRFSPQPDSDSHDYFFSLKTTGAGAVQAGHAPAEIYLNGALYRNGQPQEGQLVFRLIYHPRLAAWGLVKTILTWLRYYLFGALLYVLPGWAMLTLSLPNWQRRHWAEKISLSIGVSLAFYPLLFLWTDAVGLHLGKLYVWLPIVVGAVWSGYKADKRDSGYKADKRDSGYKADKRDSGYKADKRMGKGEEGAKRMGEEERGAEQMGQEERRAEGIEMDEGGAKRMAEGGGWVKKMGEGGWRMAGKWLCALSAQEVTLLLVLGLVFFIRLWIVRNLDVPLWGDSYQHATMTQLLLDKNGLFFSWQPYTPYNSLTIHFGFPVIVALFSWITSLDSVNATLIVGQILNGLACLTLYPLAMRISRGNRWAAVGAVLIAGLLSPMPAFYVNWGRFPQLAGQVILPIALWLTWEAIEAEKRRLPVMLLAALSLAGMTLVYNRMPFYFVTFLAALLLGWGLPTWQQTRNKNIRLSQKLWLRWMGSLLFIGVIAVLLFAPWIPRMFSGSLGSALQAGLNNARTTERVWADYQIWRQLFDFVPLPLVILTLGGLVWSLFRRQWMAASLGVWILLLASLVATALIRLPGANLMQNFAVLIALYLPISLIGGWVMGEIGGRWRIEPLLLVLALWGVWNQRFTAKPDFFTLVTRPDLRAMRWIEENTPSDALFLVEGFRYEWNSAIGSDGGWWLPLLAGRANTMPPQYALLSEKPISPDYSQRMVNLVNQLDSVSLASPEGVQLLCDEKITHVYIGQRQGMAGYNAVQLYSSEELLDNPAFELLYHQDRVYVFGLREEMCQ